MNAKRAPRLFRGPALLDVSVGFSQAKNYTRFPPSENAIVVSRQTPSIETRLSVLGFCFGIPLLNSSRTKEFSHTPRDRETFLLAALFNIAGNCPLATILTIRSSLPDPDVVAPIFEILSEMEC